MRLSFLLTLLILIFAPMHLSAVPKKKGTGIVAHRGYWNCEQAGYAKNSVAALRCAQEAGLWGSEFDVNMTSDDVLLVYHDSNIDVKSIEKHPHSEFRDVKLANGENIPTLDAYLEQGRLHPETMLVCELKGHSTPEVENRLIMLTLAKLKEYKLLDPERVMFISFSFHICRTLAQMLPEHTVQFLGSSKNPYELHEAGINGVDYNHAVYSKHQNWNKMARKKRMSVNAWTVDRKEDILKMLDMKVDQITTDEPLKVRQLMQEFKYKERR